MPNVSFTKWINYFEEIRANSFPHLLVVICYYRTLLFQGVYFLLMVLFYRRPHRDVDYFNNLPEVKV